MLDNDVPLRSFKVNETSCMEIAQAAVTLLESAPDGKGAFDSRVDDFKTALIRNGVLNEDDEITDTNPMEAGNGLSVDLETGETLLITLFQGPGNSKFAAIGITPVNARGMTEPVADDDAALEDVVKELNQNAASSVQHEYKSKHDKWPFPTGENTD